MTDRKAVLRVLQVLWTWYTEQEGHAKPLGLDAVDVYNLLPAQVVGQKSVAAMQHELQTLLKFRARNGDSFWLLSTCPSA